MAPGFYKFTSCLWSIWSDLDGGISYIRSGSNGPRCAANPESKINKSFNKKNWAFNKAGEDEEEDWEEGGVVLQCTVHDQTLAN